MRAVIHAHSGVCAGYHWFQRVCIQRNGVVVACAFFSRKRLPVCQLFVPFCAFEQILVRRRTQGRVVRRNLPARAPPLMLMLEIGQRPSIESARMAERHRYS